MSQILISFVIVRKRIQPKSYIYTPPPLAPHSGALVANTVDRLTHYYIGDAGAAVSHYIQRWSAGVHLITPT